MQKSAKEFSDGLEFRDILRSAILDQFLNISLNSRSTVNLFGALVVVVTLLTVSGSLL